MPDYDKLREAANRLVGIASTCQMQNTLPWMEGLARHINAVLEAMGDTDRVTTYGTGLQTITAEEISRLDQYGYPNQ